MPSNLGSWRNSPIILLIAAIVIPPLGLILLWLRPRPGVILKLLGSFVIATLGVAHLFLFWGLTIEVDGSAARPILSFGDHEDHYEELERNRAEQRELTAASPAAKEVPVPEPVSAPDEPSEPPPAVSVEAAAEPGDVPETSSNNYWINYRGPGLAGHYQEMDILTAWPENGLKELWRQLVGVGWGSFVVADGLAFTIEQRRDQEVVAAYDMTGGPEIRTNSWKALFEESLGGPGPRTTPTWHDGYLYALGATGEFRYLNAKDGTLVWRKNTLEENNASNLQWAMSASPLVVEDMVIVLPGGPGGRSVVAYHRLTGELVWSALDDVQAYTAPMIANLAGRRQLLVVSRDRAMGLTIDNGTLLWDYPWATDNGVNAAQPLLVGEDRFFISAGYGHGAALVKVVADGDGFRAEELWTTNRMKNKFSSSVLYEGHVYGFDEAILACLDLETGKLKWKGGRYGYGQLLLANGHLVILSERGEVVLVKATPEGHQELARFEAIDGKTWNVPAIAGGKLLVRNTREMACYQIAE